jgi:hypothetical protein
MATAAPHVKLLRQLASAKDDYLSGAFDISWDGAKATLYLVFGRPSHAVFDTDQVQIEGEAAIDALLSELPRTFVVSDWRRAMSPQETLSITIDELAGPFVRLAGSYADDPITDATPEWWGADDSSPDLAFGLADFPLLPGGHPLWEATSPEEVNLGERLAELPPSILVLTGAKLRAAAVVSGGDLIDAVWIDADDQARGEAAGMAILGATKGSLAGYALDDPRVAEALTMLWRLPLAVRGIDLSWLDPASMLAAFHSDGLDRVLVIDAPVRGVALFSRGGLVAVYSETQRSAVASPDRLRSLLSQARGRLTVMERKPRPLAADAAVSQPSATEFFAVAEDGAVSDDGAVALEAFDEPAASQDASVDTAAELDADATDQLDVPLPPPLASDAQIAAVAEASAPPAAESEAEPQPKRPWWAFGRSRRNRADASSPQALEPVAAEGDAATSSGWSVRQPEDGPKPHRYRTEGVSSDANEETPSAEAPESPTDAGLGAAEAPAPEGTRSAVEADNWVMPDPEADIEPAPEDAPEYQVAHEFWSEFADADADQPEPRSAAEAQPDQDEPTDAEVAAVEDDLRDPDRQPVVLNGVEPFKRTSSGRTVAPWSWPLAEAESPATPGSTTGGSTVVPPPPDEPVEAPLSPAPAANDPGFEEGFFQRDEPIGSQFVDFDEVRKELVRIGVVWLGESNAVPVTALLATTRATIDDFVATIDTIRGLQLEGQDPASIQAMAREMHQQAAERLCGA